MNEKEELQQITQNPSNLGAFSGMIFNALQNTQNIKDDTEIERLIKLAIKVRQKVRELSEQK